MRRAILRGAVPLLARKGKFHYVCEGIEKVSDSRDAGQYRIELTGCGEESGFVAGGRIVP
jgi:hypothetical protein